MKRKLPIIALLVGALAVTGQASAHGRGGWEGPAVFGAIVGCAKAVDDDDAVDPPRPTAYQPTPS